MQLWYPRARDRGHQHRSPTQCWHLPDLRQRDATSPHREHGAPRQNHPKSQGNNFRAWKHQLKKPLIQRGWRAAPADQESDRGKLFPVTHSHTYLFVFALWKAILEVESKASGRQKMMDRIARQKTTDRIPPQQLCPPTTGAALWEEQTGTGSARDAAAMP